MMKSSSQLPTKTKVDQFEKLIRIAPDFSAVALTINSVSNIAAFQITLLQTLLRVDDVD